MSEFIGIKDGWTEKNLTRKQILNRIEELDLKVSSLCMLVPYELNFMQKPNENENILNRVETIKNNKDLEYVIADSKLWTPGEVITVSFSGGDQQIIQKIQRTIMNSIQPFVSMKFNFVQGGGAKINVSLLNLANIGGSSAIGKQNGTQTVQIAANSLNVVQGFDWGEYLVCHEFGHALGLYHEFDQQYCGKSGVTCTGADSYSVMNYPSSMKTGSGASNARPSPNTMSRFSPKDIEWLTRVYKGSGTTPKRSITPQQFRAIQDYSTPQKSICQLKQYEPETNKLQSITLEPVSSTTCQTNRYSCLPILFIIIILLFLIITMLHKKSSKKRL
jgi:hypothetical protein